MNFEELYNNAKTFEEIECINNQLNKLLEDMNNIQINNNPLEDTFTMDYLMNVDYSNMSILELYDFYNNVNTFKHHYENNNDKKAMNIQLL